MNAFTTQQITSKPTMLKLAVVAVLSATMIACGGSGGSATNNDTGGSQDGGNNTGGSNDGGGKDDPKAKVGFSDSATWEVGMRGAEDKVNCYDFDAKAEADCANAEWDLKFEQSGRSVYFWTNGGVSGGGQGAAIPSMAWSDLKAWKNATTEPNSGSDMSRHFSADSSNSVFAQSPWFEYNLNGQHKLFPNFRVYLVTADSTSESTKSTASAPVFALQVINYYDPITGEAGYPTIRYFDLANPADVITQKVNASSNDPEVWTYVDLSSNATSVSVDESWHVAFQRNNIKLNGGISGEGSVGGFLAAEPQGFYDADGKAIDAKFKQDNTQATLTDLTNTAEYNKPATADDWLVDTKKPIVSVPAPTGNPSVELDFGWYTYDSVKHQLNAKEEADATGAIIRSNTGNSYARFWLSDIEWPTTWKFNFDIQPAAAE